MTRVNNCNKVTQKIREKKETQKTDKATLLYISKRFVSFSSRMIYTSQFSDSSRRLIDYDKQKNTIENAYFNCYNLDYIAIDCSKSKKRIV